MSDCVCPLCGLSAELGQARERIAEMEQAKGVTWHAHHERAQRAEAMLEKVRKAWAVFVIDTWEQEGNSPEVQDETVKQLAELYSDYPIGECDRCGTRAPLRTRDGDGHRGAQRVCSWGCDDGKERG